MQVTHVTHPSLAWKNLFSESALRFSLLLASVVSGAVDPKFAHGPRGKAPFFPAQELSLNARNTLASLPLPVVVLRRLRWTAYALYARPRLMILGPGEHFRVSLCTGCVTANGPSGKLSDKSPRSGREIHATYVYDGGGRYVHAMYGKGQGPRD